MKKTGSIGLGYPGSALPRTLDSTGISSCGTTAAEICAASMDALICEV
jgi:hypothetical protein